MKVKDQSFQPNVELKKAKLEKLNELLKEISAKESETTDLAKQAAAEGNIETQTIVSQLNSRYQSLIPATQVQFKAGRKKFPYNKHKSIMWSMTKYLKTLFC